MADAVVLVHHGGEDHVLVTERANGQLALVGGPVRGDRPGVQAARGTPRRVLRTETGLDLRDVTARQVGYFNDVLRDPRATADHWAGRPGS